MSATLFTSRHGLRFMIDAGGFGRDDDAAAAARENVETMINRLSLNSALLMWAGAAHLGHGIADGPGEAGDRSNMLGTRAVKAATRHWSDPSDCWVAISAVSPE